MSSERVCAGSVVKGRRAPSLWPIVGCLCVFFACSSQAGDWDVNDTGQPYKDAEFTVSEGTWMSVDVHPNGSVLLFDLLGDIYSLSTDGGDATLVHGGPAMQRYPSYSADGQRILYLSDASGADNAWVSNADGSASRQITHETVDMVAAPIWGPQEESIALVKVYTPFAKRDTSEIRLVDLAGGLGQLLVDSPKSGRDVQEARFSPDGRFLYYTERVTAPTIYVDANHMNYVIRRRELATGRAEQLIGGFGGATSPQISPDGKRIAFVRRVMSKTVLFVYDIDSGEQRPVYDQLDRDVQASYEQQSAYYPRFDWFPDNRQVAIWGKGKLYRIDVDSGAAKEIPFRVHARHRITDAVRVEQNLAPDKVTVRTVRHLAPSPDGRNMVFTALGSLWRKALPDGVPTRLTKATAFEFEPAWSVDGKKLAYVEWDDERGSALRLLAPSGASTVVTASRGLIREPAFSPDGKWLVYRIHAGDKALGGFRTTPGIYVVPVRGGAGRFVSDGSESPSFSADGARIYYTSVESSGASAPGGLSARTVRFLRSATLDGSDVRDHAVTPDVDTLDLRISPDQRWIAFRERQQYYVARYRDTGHPLLLSASGSALVPIAKLTQLGGYSLTWTSDSSSLYWTLGPALYRAEPAKLSSSQPAPAVPYAQINLTVPADVPRGTVAFINARVITMRDDEVLERGSVVVEGNRIVAVGASEAVRIPAGAKIIDATGKTLMPGFIDMHGHNECCYLTGAVSQKQPARFAELAFGITTNFDPYSSEQPAYESNETMLAGITVSPRWIPSGAVIYGRSQKLDAAYVPIADFDDARKVMERKRALGGTYIKSYKQPSRRQRQMLVKAGREAGIMIDVEGEGLFHNDITMILDGHTTLEHSLPIANYYDDVVQLFGRSMTATTPTLVVTFGELFGENYMYQTQRSWDDPKVKAYVQELPASRYSPINAPGAAPPYVRNMTSIHAADEVYDIGFRAVSRANKKLDDAGVLVNAGSHGQIAGLGLHWEMWLLAEGGMSNHNVLRAATSNGARTLALQRQIGSLQPGMLADLIVLDANPLEDIHNTNTVRYTMLNGRLYDSLSMNEVGNYDRPRSRFYWELQNRQGIDWNESWTGQ
ncbi:amidohydrolase family protein [Steroidobacter sp.]|uniref:amidohydrolase family protein n=1 Tax=Steroidobacter sp. TaxID=1978227 RepID=UPI001A39CE0A|nr:amidohydrolase family protein [Steroidobacter sp.]MBL8271884.1 PD40 domain-containing protein [Steroidobacter sp.]